MSKILSLSYMDIEHMFGMSYKEEDPSVNVFIDHNLTEMIYILLCRKSKIVTNLLIINKKTD